MVQLSVQASNSFLYVKVKKQSKLYSGEYRLNYSETEIVKNVSDIKNNIIRETLNYLNISDKLYIGTISDVPASTGLTAHQAVFVLDYLMHFINLRVKMYLQEDLQRRLHM